MEFISADSIVSFENPGVISRQLLNPDNSDSRRVTITEYKAAAKAVEDYLRAHPGDVDYNTVANLQQYTGVVGRYLQQQDVDIVETETHILRIGTVAFATNPFELFLDYANRIKARSFAEQTFIRNGKQEIICPIPWTCWLTCLPKSNLPSGHTAGSTALSVIFLRTMWQRGIPVPVCGWMFRKR